MFFSLFFFLFIFYYFPCEIRHCFSWRWERTKKVTFYINEKHVLVSPFNFGHSHPFNSFHNTKFWFSLWKPFLSWNTFFLFRCTLRHYDSNDAISPFLHFMHAKYSPAQRYFSFGPFFYSPCLFFYFSHFFSYVFLFLVAFIACDKFLIYFFFFIRYVMQTRAKLSLNACCCIHCHTEQPFILNKSSSFASVAFALMLHSNLVSLSLQTL